MLGLNADALAAYRRLLAYLKPQQRRVLIAACSASVLYAGVAYWVPGIMARVFALFGTAPPTLQNALVVPLLIVVALGIRGITDFLIVYGLSWVGRGVVRDLRSDLFKHYLGLPTRYYDRNSTGVLLSRLTYNTEQVA